MRRALICTYTSRGSIRPRRPAAMYQMLGVFAEFERAIIRERVMAGLARAKAEGTRLGRPASIADDAAKVKTMRAARSAGKSIRAIAREYGVGVGTVSRPNA